MKIGICDDSQRDRETLKAILLPALPTYTTLECYGHGFELLESHGKKPFDILFLDIGMPHLSGIDVAKELRISCQSTHIIFVTQYRDYAAESYAVHAFSYLVKPFKAGDILPVFYQAQQKLLRRGRRLAIKANYDTVYVPVSDIVFAETIRQKLLIHTNDQHIETRMTMQELSQQVEDEGFYRPHNSYIVNLSCIRAIQNRFILMEGEILIPIGKSRRVSEIKATILLWRGRQ